MRTNLPQDIENMNIKFVLGIETSCDDTSVSILDVRNVSQKAQSSLPIVLAHHSFSQEIMLAKWGGVVPEIAARNHLDKIVPLLDQALKTAELSPESIDLIGVTTTPGLLGPLLTGLNAAKTLALYFKKPIAPVNHLYAHLEAIHLTQKQSYPYLGLLVSGGHSLYLLVESATQFEILGGTIDDAAGEAFDKGGKLIGLGYPAGKLIDELSLKGDPKKYAFPVGLRDSADTRLSFSGLKTSLRLFLEKNPELYTHGKDHNELHQRHFDLCASYQYAITSALKLKMRYAMKELQQRYGKKLPIVVGGGVACNSSLRSVLQEEYRDISFVRPEYCTDNGAMVANYAYRIREHAISFPDCLSLDSKGRFIEKSLNRAKKKNKSLTTKSSTVKK